MACRARGGGRLVIGRVAHREHAVPAGRDKADELPLPGQLALEGRLGEDLPPCFRVAQPRERGSFVRAANPSPRLRGEGAERSEAGEGLAAVAT
jgi:hypothetical protein